MARSWFLTIKDDLPTLDAFLRKFVELYIALDDKHDYQDWFAAWWHWWCLQGLIKGRTVSASTARFFYSPEERKEMFELLDECIQGASINLEEHPERHKLKIHGVDDLAGHHPSRCTKLGAEAFSLAQPPPLTPASQSLPFKLEPNASASETENEDFKEDLKKWRQRRKNNLSGRVSYDRRRAAEQGRTLAATRTQHVPGESSTNPSFKTPNIAKCARLLHEGKPLESEYMPDGWEQHPHASSSANSLAHSLLHNYSHRQRAIYGI